MPRLLVDIFFVVVAQNYKGKEFKRFQKMSSWLRRKIQKILEEPNSGIAREIEKQEMQERNI